MLRPYACCHIHDGSSISQPKQNILLTMHMQSYVVTVARREVYRNKMLGAQKLRVLQERERKKKGGGRGGGDYIEKKRGGGDYIEEKKGIAYSKPCKD